MIWIISSFICMMIAAACNAVMDKCSFHFYRSIFSNLDDQFWNPELSWKNKYVDGDSRKGRVKWFFGFNKPVQISDAFHLFKTIGIFCICAAPTLVLMSDVSINIVYLIFIYLGYGVTWNMTFSLFFDKILVKKLDK